MKNIKFLITSLIILPLVAGCDFKKDKGTYVIFHQDGIDDVSVKFDSSMSLNEIQTYEPDLVLKDGYYGVWEEYDIEGKDSSFTVNVKYTPITYYVDFKAQGFLVDSVPFTIEDISGEHSKISAEKTPKIPANSWCEPYWEDYSLSLNNIVVNAKYDVLKDFTVKFMANGEQIGQIITINKSNLDGEGKIKSELIPDEVKNYTLEHHDVIWNFTVLEGIDTVITADIPLHSYYVKFVDFDGNQFGDLVPYNYNSTWENMNKPDAPKVNGYTTSWNDTVLSYSDDNVVTATPKKVANEYRVYFDGNEGYETVTFDSEYALTNKASALKRWADESGRFVYNEGVWNIASNVTLHLIDITKEDFGSLVVPSFIDITNSINIKSVEIKENAGINGKNALKAVVNAGSDFGLSVKKDYIDQVFANPDVKSLNIVIKSNIHNDNFRHRTGGSNICYEFNNLNYGLETIYKKFSFTRTMYNSHLATGDFIIYGGMPNSGTCANSELYIDSFIFNEDDVISSVESVMGFENGYAAKGSTVRWYTAKEMLDSSPQNYFELQIGNGVTVSKFGYNFEYTTEGIRSLTFSKSNGYISLYLPAYFNAAFRNSTSQQFTFDIYIDLYDQPVINSNSSVKNMVDGYNVQFDTVHPAREWVTYTMSLSQVGNDGRFLIFQGSTAGDYYLDNFRVVE